jgi:hypothetical protein
MSTCLSTSWGDSQEWHLVDPKSSILTWVARLSSRIFLGETFVQNPEWIRISIDYTVNTMIAIAICKFVPSFIRPAVVQWLPLCRKVRRDYATCSSILKPVLEEREREIASAEQEGRKPDLPDDSIEWFRSASRGREYRQIDIQISLQVAAIHTTSDLLCQALLNLCAHPELVAPLREEVKDVLGKYGWQKVALTELRLLDSFFKETQRLKPISMGLSFPPYPLPSSSRQYEGISLLTG